MSDPAVAVVALGDGVSASDRRFRLAVCDAGFARPDAAPDPVDDGGVRRGFGWTRGCRTSLPLCTAFPSPGSPGFTSSGEVTEVDAAGVPDDWVALRDPLWVFWRRILPLAFDAALPSRVVAAVAASASAAAACVAATSAATAVAAAVAVVVIDKVIVCVDVAHPPHREG